LKMMSHTQLNKCDACGVFADTRNVLIGYNIGLVFFRLDRHIEGNLCRRCIRYFAPRFILKNLLFGWWGVFSFIATVVYLFYNIFTYIRSYNMQASPTEGVENTWGRPLSIVGGCLLVLIGTFFGLVVLLPNPDP